MSRHRCRKYLEKEELRVRGAAGRELRGTFDSDELGGGACCTDSIDSGLVEVEDSLGVDTVGFVLDVEDDVGVGFLE